MTTIPSVDRQDVFSLFSLGARKKITDGCSDLVGMRLERKVTRVEEAYFRSWNVTLERFRTCRQEKGIVLAPDRQERRFVLAEVGLEFRIHGDVALVVAKE